MIYYYFPTKVSGKSHYQLFTLAKDPFERTDLSTAELSTLKRLMQGLIAGLEKQGAVYPVDKATGSPVKPKIP